MQAPQTPAASSNSQSSVKDMCVPPSRPCPGLPDVDEGEGEKSSRKESQTQVKDFLAQPVEEKKTVEENTEGVNGSGQGVEKKTASTPGVQSAKRSAVYSPSRAVVPKTSSGQPPRLALQPIRVETKHTDLSHATPDFLDTDTEDERPEITRVPASSVSKQLAEPVSTQIGDEEQQVSAGSKNFDEADAFTASSSTASSSGNVAYSYILALFPYT